MTYQPAVALEDVPTVDSMVDYLDRYIAGLVDFKRRLCLTVHRHLVAGIVGIEHPPNMLVIGPSGGGKTATLRTLLEALPCPHTTVACTAFTDTGYTGVHLSSIYPQLVSMRWRELENGTKLSRREAIPIAERTGIVVLDEFDKLRRLSNAELAGQRVVGPALQAELLTLAEGTVVQEGEFSMRTDGVLHIGVGAFQGLDQVVAKGLNAGSHEITDTTYTRAVLEDIVAYGFLEELVGRFSTLAILPPLQPENLVKILNEHILPGYHRQFEAMGLVLQVDDGAKMVVSQRAALQPIGARALVPELERMLTKSWALAKPGQTVYLGAQEAIREHAVIV